MATVVVAVAAANCSVAWPSPPLASKITLWPTVLGAAAFFCS